MALDRPPISHDISALKKIAEEWMERVWRQHDLEAIDTLHAPDFIDHSPAGRNPDNASFRAGIAELYAAFPDFYTHTDDLVADPSSGKIAIRWSATGTHSQAFLGFSASGRLIEFSGIEILHILNGRIVERWGEWDGLSILEKMRFNEISR